MLAPIRTVAPAEQILTLARVKAHLRVDHDDDDMTISNLMDAATAHVDGYAGVLGLTLVTQTWSVAFPTFKNRLDIPLGPVQSATIQYYDSVNSLQTLPQSVYALLSDGLGPYAGLKYNQQWPQTYTRDDAVRITFVAGYGGAAAVPAAIKQAMLLLIGHWYEERNAVNVGNISTNLPFTVDALLAPYRRVPS